MGYSVGRLAKLSGVSARTLRYYDQIGLLCPSRGEDNGYRVYGEEQLCRLQQILFFRELGFELRDIASIVDSKDFERYDALEYQLSELSKEKERLEKLIETVRRSMEELKGGSIMSDKEKFEGFKKEMLEENERKYGKELRQKYGSEAIDSSIFKVKGMSEQQWQSAEALREEINLLLTAAMRTGDSGSAAARQVFEKHREWLLLFWKDTQYSPTAHASLAEMYAADERFTAYYDKACGAGATLFLRDIIANFTK